jgi:hypothetical protein
VTGTMVVTAGTRGAGSCPSSLRSRRSAPSRFTRRETRQSLRHRLLPAKDGEVACGLHPCVVLRHDFPGAVSETKWPTR